ncbi:hypothetical protein UPYG_G00159070 [Umbra pygmaea]|uniref:Uncharacterized protein n=1 Tax=Umbra pygmaea TaxID=75934 RepID=A0ABD0XNN9_UMBPY
MKVTTVELPDGDLVAKGASGQHVGLLIQHQDQPASVYSPGSVFALKVEVTDRSSRHVISLARVDVYVNFTRTNSALTTENGVVMLSVPYQLGLPVTIVASRDGYLHTSMPWKTNKMPVFSAVTVSLLSNNQGNIYWFEDSVIITGKTFAFPQSRIQFPRSLLNMTDLNPSSVRVYFTTPQPTAGKDSYTTGLLINNPVSGYSSIELSPIAGVNAQLWANGREVQVAGPIQITLPLGQHSGLGSSQAVPAWLYNHTTGAWMNRGTGTVKVEEGRWIWSFVAPHLGHWLAAPWPSSGGYMEHATLWDFLSYHSASIMAVLGGTFVMVLGVFAVMICCLSEQKTTKINGINMASMKMDETPSAYDNHLCEVTSPHSQQSKSESLQSVKARTDDRSDDSASSNRNDDINLYSEDTDAVGPALSRTFKHTHPFNRSGALWDGDISEQIRLPLSVNDSLFFQDRLLHFHNKTVAILHSPGPSSLPEHPSPGCRSATPPRADGEKSPGQRQSADEDNLTQTLPTEMLLQGQQGGLEGSQGISYCSLPESVSVPNRLDESRGRGGHWVAVGRPFSSELYGAQWNPEQSLPEPRRARPRPSSLTPRAWFVSLEGKPAAAICRNPSSVTGSRRRCEAKEGDSHDASLDSGVDMSEPNVQPTDTRRKTTLDRSGTFIKRNKLPITPPLYVSGEDADQRGTGNVAMEGHTPMGTIAGTGLDDVDSLIMEFLESNKANLCNWLSVNAQYIIDKCEDILTVKQGKDVLKQKTDADKINMLLNTIIEMGNPPCEEFHEILKKEQQYFTGLQQHFSESTLVYADHNSTVDIRKVTEVQTEQDLNMNVSVQTGGVNQPGVHQPPPCADFVATNNSCIFASKLSKSKVGGDLNLNLTHIHVPQGSQHQVTSRQTEHSSSQGPAMNIIIESKVQLIDWLRADHLFILQHVQTRCIITDREYQELKSFTQPEDVTFKNQKERSLNSPKKHVFHSKGGNDKATGN